MTPLERQVVIRECIKRPWYARTLAYELAAWVNRYDQCRPNQATLAEYTGLSTRTIRRAIAHLVSIKGLVVDHGVGRRATYTLTLNRVDGAKQILKRLRARKATQSGQKGQRGLTHRSGIEKWDNGGIEPPRGYCEHCGCYRRLVPASNTCLRCDEQRRIRDADNVIALDSHHKVVR